MQHGFASRNGLFGALMAAGGYSGIKRVFEEPYGGFLTMFSQGSEKDPPYLEQELVKGLGEIWQLESIRVKPYASMAATHCSIDTVAALQKEYPDKLRDRATITKIVFEMSEPAYKHGGWKPQRPLTATGAQMSCAYVAAVQMVDGQVLPQQFRADQLDRDVIWELVEKTECVQNDMFTEIFSQRATIVFRDGSEISKTLKAPKGVDPTLSNEEIVDKYRSLTKGLISDGRQKAIEDAVLGLEKLQDISQLEALLVDLTLSPFR
jgi:aconitate decarboxylase